MDPKARPHVFEFFRSHRDQRRQRVRLRSKHTDQMEIFMGLMGGWRDFAFDGGYAIANQTLDLIGRAFAHADSATSLRDAVGKTEIPPWTGVTDAPGHTGKPRFKGGAR